MDVCLCAFVYGADYHVYMYMSFSRHMVSQPSRPVLSVPAWARGPLVEVSIGPAWPVANPALGPLLEKRVPCFSPWQKVGWVA